LSVGKTVGGDKADGCRRQAGQWDQSGNNIDNRRIGLFRQACGIGENACIGRPQNIP